MASRELGSLFAECDRDSVYPERFVKAFMGIDSLPGRTRRSGSGFCYRRRRLEDGTGTSLAPTYVLYQLPESFNTFPREGTQEQIR